jgi:L-ascorbate metabolism protein UlaG (beta-lactamase superfamily)
LIETEGIKIVTDPYDNSIGYGPINIPVDIVTVSHDHFDHNHVQGLKGKPETIKKKGTHNVKGITFTAIETFHDASKGTQRGNNLVFIMEAEGLRLCHAGDLGHVLSKDQIKAIGNIDILLLPVGGTYTIDADEATKVMNDLDPKLVIPMHFKTKVLNFPISDVDLFIKGKKNVKKANSSHLEVTKETLPKEREIWVLKHML